MSEIIIESKLNYHTQEELDNFGSFLLEKIRDIRFSHNGIYRNFVDNAFDSNEIDYPERFFIGVHRSVVGEYVYYVFQRSLKNKIITYSSKHSFNTYKYALHFASKYKRNLYKGNHKNNLPKKMNPEL